jgi:ATP-dependent DNA ligase
MSQIANDGDAEWQSNRSHSRDLNEPISQPPVDSDLSRWPKATASFIEPMQAKLVDTLPSGKQWSYEAKFDGYRAIGVKSGKIVRLLSRNNNDLTKQFPDIAKALQKLDSDTVVDGEIVALD